MIADYHEGTTRKDAAMKLAQWLDRLLTALGIEPADDALVAEQYRILKRQIPALYCVLLLSTATLAYHVAVRVSWTTAYLYPLVAIPLVAVRLAVWLKRGQQPAPENPVQLRSTLSLTTALTALLAAGLGAWGLALTLATNGLEQAFVPIYIALGAITCAYCLSPVPKAALLTLALSTIAPSVAVIALGDPLMKIVGTNLLLITALVMKLIVSQYQQIARIVHLSRPNWDETDEAAVPFAE